MRKLILKMTMSLDGFVCGPNGELDWLLRHRSPDGIDWTVKTVREASAHLMGRRTYQDMASFWPYSTDPVAAPMNEIPKIVFSRQGGVRPRASETTAALDDAKRADPPAARPSAAVLASWENPSVVGDLAPGIERLKKEGGGKPLLAHGGAGFARELVATGLIDEYLLLTCPVLLGRGRSPFSDLPKPLDLALAESRSFSSGVTLGVYRPKK